MSLTLLKSCVVAVLVVGVTTERSSWMDMKSNMLRQRWQVPRSAVLDTTHWFLEVLEDKTLDVFRQDLEWYSGCPMLQGPMWGVTAGIAVAWRALCRVSCWGIGHGCSSGEPTDR